MRRLVMTALKHVELQDGPAPDLPPGWVRLEMRASALGLTQLQLLAGSTATGGLPRVLGHEMVGRVAELGAGVEAPALGALVVVDCLFGCGRCGRCLEGDEVVCPTFRMVGYTIDGGYAEQVVVPATHVFELPAGTDPAEAVMLASALPSSVRAVRRSGLVAGQRAVVVGAGSIGDLLAQVARAQGATVVVADTDHARLADIAGHADAGVALTAGEPLAEARARLLRAVGGDRGADVAFEAAGTRDALELALAVTRPGGTLLAAGLAPGNLAFDQRTVREAVVQEITVRGSFAFARRDFPAVIGLYLNGRIDLSTVMAPPIRLEAVPDTLAEMWGRGTRGRRHPVLIA